MDEPAAEDCVLNLILDQCAAGYCNEGVLVNPATIGAPALFIDEGVRRVPRGYLALPTDWNTAQFQAIVDSSSYLHLDWRGCQHSEMQPRRCNLSQVLGI